MKRRTLLTVTGGLTSGALAGCLGSQLPTGTPADSPTETPAETPAGAEGPTRWEVAFEDEPTRPAVGPLAYVGAGRTAYGLDPFTGDEVWTRTFGAPTQFFYVHGDTVYAITYEEEMGSEATVAALEANDGDERWTFEFDGPGSVFALGDGLAILKTYDDIGNGREQVYAFDESGSLLWEETMFEPKNAVLRDGTLFVANGRRVKAVDARTGTPRWRYPLDGYQFGTLTVGPDTVAGVNVPDPREPELFALDRAGIERWTFDEWVPTGPTIHEGLVFAGGQKVAAFDAETGDREWARDRGGFLYQAPVVEGMLLAGGSAVHAYDVEDGSQRWAYEPGPDLVIPEEVRNETVYVHTSVSNDEGKRHVYGVDVDREAESWHLSTGTELSDLAVGRQGAYVTEKAGTLYALA